MAFSTLVALCHHHLYLVLEHFHQPQGAPGPQQTLPIAPSCPLAAAHLLSEPVGLPVPDISHKWAARHATLRVWHLPPPVHILSPEPLASLCPSLLIGQMERTFLFSGCCERCPAQQERSVRAVVRSSHPAWGPTRSRLRSEGNRSCLVAERGFPYKASCREMARALEPLSPRQRRGQLSKSQPGDQGSRAWGSAALPGLSASRCPRCVRFLWLLQYITAHCATSHNTDLYPHSSARRKSEVRGWTEPGSRRGLCGRVLPLPAPDGSRHSSACGHIPPTPASVIPWPPPVCVFLKGQLSLG